MSTVGHLFAALLAALLCGSASAQSTANLRLIVDQQREIAVALDSGDSQGLSDRNVERIRAAQERVFKLTEGKANMNSIRTDDKVKLANLLDEIKMLMGNKRTDREDQMICNNEKILGSNIVQIRCGTHEEFETRREGARDSLEQRHVCVPPGCGQ